MINAERAVLHAPVFEKKLARTRRMLLEKLIAESYSRRKAKMPKPSKPVAEKDKSDGALKGLLPQIAGLRGRERRHSSADASVMAVAATAGGAEVKPTSSEPSLPIAVNVTHGANILEESDDLLTMASSKQVKQYLAKKVDALYEDEDVTRMMEKDLGDAEDEEEDRPVSGSGPATPVVSHPQGPPSLKHAIERPRAASIDPTSLGTGPATLPARGPKGHSRKPSNTNDPVQALHHEAKKRAGDLIQRLNTAYELLGKKELPERYLAFSRILKVCNEVRTASARRRSIRFSVLTSIRFSIRTCKITRRVCCRRRQSLPKLALPRPFPSRRKSSRVGVFLLSLHA